MTKEEYEALPEHLQKIMARPPIPMWDADSLYLENAKTGEKREWVRVIRCKDCKHCHESNVLICRCPKVSYWCEGKRNLRVEPDDFCSWAERKEE